MMRSIRVCLLLAAISFLLTVSGCHPDIEVAGLEIDADLDLDAVSNTVRRGVNTRRSAAHGYDYDSTNYIGDNWTVRSLLEVGTYRIRSAEGAFLSDDTYYLCLATDEVEGDLKVNVSLFAVRGEGPPESSSVIMSAGELPPDPLALVRHLKPHLYGDETSPVIAFTYPRMMNERSRVWLMAGWINDPRVHEFKIRLSNAATVTLCAEKHRFFVGVAARRGIHGIAGPNVVIDSITAMDSQGNIIP